MRVIVVSSLEDAFTSVTVPVIVLPSATERAEMIKEDKAGAAGPRCCVSIRRRTRSPRIQCSRCRYGWLDCHRLNGRIVARDHPSRSASKTPARGVDPRTPIPADKLSGRSWSSRRHHRRSCRPRRSGSYLPRQLRLWRHRASDTAGPGLLGVRLD